MHKFVSTLSSILVIAFLASMFSAIASSQAPQVAQTPPMGWNSWNFFARNVEDKDIRAAADQLVATGMRDAGYIYVNIDDTWEGQRDAERAFFIPTSKFPDL